MSSKKELNPLKGLRILKEESAPHRTMYGREFFHRELVEDSEVIQKLAHFSDCVHSGVFPDDKVMIFMANAIQTYLNEKTETLDDAFLLKPIKGQGSAAKNYRIKCEAAELIATVLQYQADENLTQEQAIFNTLELHEIDLDKADAFKKKYQRKKNKRLNKQNLNSEKDM